MQVVTPEQMRKIDERAIKEFEIPGIILMENAAIQVVNLLEEKYPNLCQTGKTLVLAGRGNNGGDGLAIARHLMLRGYQVEVILLFLEESLEGDTGINLQIIKKLGTKIHVITKEDGAAELKPLLDQADLVIDAILGTGLSRNIEGFLYKVIEYVNIRKIPVIAVDIPSGVHGVNGHIMGIAIKAKDTVTFAYPKQGHLLYPGREYIGSLKVAPISIPSCSHDAIGVKGFTLDDSEISMLLKDRPPRGHKGTFGKVAVIGGSIGMTGAACLTGMAALRGGAGLVTVGVPASLNPIFENKLTEVMTIPLEDGGSGYFGLEAIDQIPDFIRDKDVLAIGPGLGIHCNSFEFLRYILEGFDIPIVLDADALNHISRDMRISSFCKGRGVLTPHPGEMARLTGKSVNEIIEYPVDAAQSLAKELGVIVLLKGAGSVVAHPDGRIYFNQSGNSGLGTGGSGDVLTGLIAALIAQGYSLYDAAVYGCYIHGRAGDYARELWGDVGMIAGDVVEILPLVFKDLYHLKQK